MQKHLLLKFLNHNWPLVCLEAELRGKKQRSLVIDLQRRVRRKRPNLYQASNMFLNHKFNFIRMEINNHQKDFKDTLLDHHNAKLMS